MKILYKLASRQRKDKCFAAIDNIISMAEHDDYLILCSFDLDDLTMANEEVRNKINSYGSEVKAVYGNSKTKIQAINADTWMIYDWSVIINFSDDFEIVQKGFDLRVISDMRRYFPDTDGCLHYNDGTVNGSKIMTMSIIGREYYERTNCIYYKEYLSVFCDNEETRRAQELNRIQYFPDVLFKHNHWLFDKRLKDSLNERNDNLNIYERDRSLFLKRNPVLLIKYASRGRKKLFFKALENIHATIKTKYFSIIVTADANDPEMNCEDVRWVISTFPNVKIYYGEQVSKIDAINRSMDYNLEWSWSIVMSDDMVFTVKGWDESMLQSIKKQWGDSLDFFAHFNDGYTHDKLPTLNVCGRDYYKRFNYLYSPTYGSVSCDAENYFVAQMLGRYKYFPEIYFNHVHPSNIGFHSDKTYRDNDRFGKPDTANYFNRMGRLFDVKNPVMIPEILRKEMEEKQMIII